MAVQNQKRFPRWSSGLLWRAVAVGTILVVMLSWCAPEAFTLSSSPSRRVQSKIGRQDRCPRIATATMGLDSGLVAVVKSLQRISFSDSSPQPEPRCELYRFKTRLASSSGAALPLARALVNGMNLKDSLHGVLTALPEARERGEGDDTELLTKMRLEDELWQRGKVYRIVLTGGPCGGKSDPAAL
ncbi:hypothetical protein AK812_SmicGene3660 [Symbiodinium microadriaticum]|uniref:Uncharacterized protein n=1 Tax=Symbiodinium microadriaticum TaxID=2951 RepID=A0A1Q9EYM0_SYMMI|nr:hypothetical protein AK812_SmicGene3660 [Symbiodinium microadriaticum]